MSSGSSTFAGPRSSRRTRRATSRSRSSTSLCSARPTTEEYVAELDAHLAACRRRRRSLRVLVRRLPRALPRSVRPGVRCGRGCRRPGRRALHGREGPHRAGRRAAPAARGRRPSDDRRRLCALVGEPRAGDGCAGSSPPANDDERVEAREALAHARRRDGQNAGGDRGAGTAMWRRTCAPPVSPTPRSSACGSALPLLELRDVEARYGEISALRGVSLTRRRRRLRRDPRCERRREDDDTSRDLGHGQDDRRRRVRGREALPAHTGGDGTSRCRARAPRARHVHDALGARQPAARCVGAAGDARIGTSPASTSSSRGSTSGETSRRARSPAASSSCSRSVAR